MKAQKKVEVIVNDTIPALRSLEREFWGEMVKKANAEIISEISNDLCDAYLLSESSLFVWDDRFLMLTYGTTTLIESVVYFVDTYGENAIEFFIYQRKNEYKSNLQLTSVEEDLAKLRERLPMNAYRLGYLDSHHHYLMHYDKAYKPLDSDHTSELLMYHIRGEVAQYLRSANQTVQKIREHLCLDSLFSGFVLDDFAFSPCGYSINAIKGDKYATIHITPEENSSYVSLETNLNLSAEYEYIYKKTIAILKPKSWDFVSFDTKKTDSEYSNRC
ncbi:adenosylmethionine decarboxylase [Photobacterium leiognathi]|uniref:adenosylmethionine decarboxylase n=1 Tax=Photobacterium leiognathi TaxID=553611 RepID=UPI00273A3951|nr:adenosylmethionine decarboxylase [Photobacterium leiognathi]